MKITRLRNKLLLGAIAISILVALASMLAVSWVISQQHLNQSSELLRKAFRIVDDSLDERKANLLAASRQLATQNNLGSTIWYLAQYTQSGIDRETLFNTYQQLIKDTYKIGRVAKLSRVFIYDSAGNLVSFALFGSGSDQVGFVERFPQPLFQVGTLQNGEEFNRQMLRATSSVAKVALRFDGPLPQHESVHYAVEDGLLAIESHVPIMGVAFDPATGKQEIKQLGLVATVQPLDQAYVDHLARLTDLKINLFTPQGFSLGGVAAYRTPDWSRAEVISDPGANSAIAFNEIVIDGEGFYQCLMPLYTGKNLIGTITALHSQELVRKNTWEMVQTLGVIAVACQLFIFPFAWFFAASISRPLTALSHIFRGVASGEQADNLSKELGQLEKEKNRHDELGNLTQNFIAMDEALRQKIQQINEINASLEHKVEQRTQELRLANDELTKLAAHDVLTGLPNRKLLSDRLQQALATARRNSAHLALMYIDLDDFKPINDTYGHATGDLLLKETAGRIQDCVRESDTVARIGGDEFLVLLPLIESEQDAIVVAEKIRLALNQPFDLAGKRLCISSSAGIAIYPEHGGEEGVLLKNADAAMYDAKESGRNVVKLFCPGQLAAASETLL